MSLVGNNVTDESGHPLANIYTEVVLLAEQAFSGSNQIISRVVTRTDEFGAWQLELFPNDSIIPANTVYQVRHIIPGFPDDVSFFVVPDGGGQLVDLLVAAPNDLPTQASLVQFAPFAEMTSTDVQAAIEEAWGHSGGGSVIAVIAGAGISVDASDPAQPIVSATGGGGGGGAGEADWTNITLENGYVPLGATPQYRKDANGIVHLRGGLDASSASAAVFGHLPVGYRPEAILIIPCAQAVDGGGYYSQQIVNLGVVTDGTLIPQTGVPQSMTIDGVHFYDIDAGAGGTTFPSDMGEVVVSAYNIQQGLTYGRCLVSPFDVNQPAGLVGHCPMRQTDWLPLNSIGAGDNIEVAFNANGINGGYNWVISGHILVWDAFAANLIDCTFSAALMSGQSSFNITAVEAIGGDLSVVGGGTGIESAAGGVYNVLITVEAQWT